MLYFIKNGTIHTLPVGRRCKVAYEKEKLCDTIPHGVKECPFCMNVWPGE